MLTIGRLSRLFLKLNTMKHLSITKGVRPVNCPDTFVQWAREVIYGQPKHSEFNKKISFLKQRTLQTLKKRLK